MEENNTKEEQKEEKGKVKRFKVDLRLNRRGARLLDNLWRGDPLKRKPAHQFF